MLSAFALISTILTASPLQFYLDWSAFRHTADSCRVEFYYGVPYDQLTFQPVEGELVALFDVTLTMQGLTSHFSETGTIRKRARLRSFQEAITSKRLFVDQFSVIAPPGTYHIQVQLTDTLNSGTIVDTITVPDLSRGLGLSSIQLAAGLIKDTLTGRLAIVPNPRHTFPVTEHLNLYLYFEGYGLAPDSTNYEVRYALLNQATGDTVISSSPIVRQKTGTSTALTLELGLDSIKPGDYKIAVQLTDPGANQTASAEHPLTIASETPTPPTPSPFTLTLSPREERYYREIQFLATPRELAYYNSLSDSGKTAYLAWFWSRHNLGEFVRRMETAETRFKTARTPGVKTDRGRIYVKYGEPDAVERKTMEMEIKPREYWFYYQEGLTFIFVDLRGDGNYRLVWTNSPEEPATGLEGQLTPEEENQFR